MGAKRNGKVIYKKRMETKQNELFYGSFVSRPSGSMLEEFIGVENILLRSRLEQMANH